MTQEDIAEIFEQQITRDGTLLANFMIFYDADGIKSGYHGEGNGYFPCNSSVVTNSIRWQPPNDDEGIFLSVSSR